MKRLGKRILLLLLLFGGLFFSDSHTKEAEAAATSYTDAKEFYESTAKNDYTATHNGAIYVATKAKKASSDSNLKYYTLGHDVKLYNGPYNAYSVTFSVKRNTSESPSGSMIDVDQVISGNYVYNLYKIPIETVKKFAYARSSAMADSIFSQDIIYVEIDSIMTTKQKGSYHGGIAEDGKGNVSTWGTVYRLTYEDTDLYAMKSIFAGHGFQGFYNVRTDIKNYPIVISYDVNGGKVNSVGYTTKNDIVYYCGELHSKSYRLYDTVNLYDFHQFGLTRTGYHIDSGKEWKYNYRGTVFSEDKDYWTQDIEPDIGSSGKAIGVRMKANWKINTYNVKYNANGGKGSVASQTFTYNESGKLRNNTYTRVGYRLKPGAEWNTEANGSGTNYTSRQAILNMTKTHNETITLYANWEPINYTIYTEQGIGSGGTEVFCELYDRYFHKGNYSVIESIVVPEKTGYTFHGYYTSTNGQGKKIIDSEGNIVVPNTYFTADATIYAYWERTLYTITFDKQGGRNDIGTNKASVYYGERYPSATEPYREGYTFKGYFTDTNYETQVYNEYMSPLEIYNFTSDTTVYAKWVDESPPVTTIRSSTEEWTNMAEGVVVTATAYDKVSGLDYVELYRNATLIDKKENLNGTKETVTFTLIHTDESAYRYRVVAYDMSGVKSEAYTTVKYDITKPWGRGLTEPDYTYTLHDSTLTSFSIEVKAFDYEDAYEGGLYDAIGNQIASWSELVNVYGFDIEADHESGASGGTLNHVIATYGLDQGVHLVIDDSVTRIGEFALSGCSQLKRIDVGSSVASIGKGAFGKNPNLTTINVSEDNTVYDGRDNANGIIETATNTLAIGFIETVIPESVTKIGDYAYYECETLKDLSIPTQITSIGNAAYYGCSGLSGFETIPANIITIGDYAFYNCNKVARWTFKEGLKQIGDYAFAYTNHRTTTLTIPSSVTKVGNYAFYGNKTLTYVSVPIGARGNTTIGAYAFAECLKLKSIDLQGMVVSIGDYAFAYCDALSSINMSWSDTTSVLGVTDIGNYAFAYCPGLTSVTIPTSVTNIGNYAYAYCNNLESITLPNTIALNGTQFVDSGVDVKEYIGYWYEEATGERYAAADIPSFTAATYVVKPPAGLYDAKGRCVASWTELTDTYGLDISTTYSVYNLLKNYGELSAGTQLIIGDSATTIGKYAFYGCDQLKNIIIGENIEEIKENAFFSCGGITEIDIPDNVTMMGASAFERCENLETVTIGNGLSIMPYYAFGICNNLKTVNLGENFMFIGECAFYYCKKLESINIPDNVSHIYSDAFYGCSSLTSINMPSNLMYIYASAFENCTGLTEITIPDSVRYISENAFAGCTNLTRVTIGSNIRTIYSQAFYNCTKLKAVYFTNTTTPSFNSKCFYKTSGDSCTFYFKNQEVYDAFTTNYYNASFGEKSTNFNW